MIDNSVSIILSGTSGTGKTSLFRDEYLHNKPEGTDITVLMIHANQFLTCELLWEQLNNVLEWKHSNFYQPMGNKRLVCFIKDLQNLKVGQSFSTCLSLNGEPSTNLGDCGHALEAKLFFSKTALFSLVWEKYRFEKVEMEKTNKNNVAREKVALTSEKPNLLFLFLSFPGWASDSPAPSATIDQTPECIQPIQAMYTTLGRHYICSHFDCKLYHVDDRSVSKPFQFHSCHQFPWCVVCWLFSFLSLHFF